MSNSVGDLDADGVDDFITSAAFYGPQNRGRLYVYSGLDGSLALPAITGTNNNESLGFSANSAGDVDNDGVPDVIGGAPGNSAGRAFVYSGATGLLLRTFSGEALGDTFGIGSTGLGDINGDGHSDLLIGAPQRAAPGVQQGRAYVYSGLDSSLLCQADGEGPSHRFGETVARVKDINSDGIPDFVVGAKDAGPAAVGRAYVFSGADCVGGATILPVFTLQPAGSAFDFGLYFMDSGDLNGDGTPDIYVSDFSVNRAHIFSGVDGLLLRAINGTPGSGFGIGRFVGDVNGDGCDDLILASWVDNTGGTQAGMAEVLSGRDIRLLQRYTHNVPFAQFGFDANSMHDVDGDGMTDYLVTAANDLSAAGKAYLLAGDVAPVPTTPRCLVVGWASANVQAFDIPDGAFHGTLVASGSGGLASAHSVVVGPDRMLYVSSAGTNRILRYHPVTGAFVSTFVNPAGTPLNAPMDAIFGPDGHLYVASFNSGHVLRFNGVTGAYIGIFATGPGVLGQVEMLTFGPDGHLYVANGERNSVTRYDGTTGAPLPGPLGAPGTADFVLADSGGLNDPHSLEFGPDGNLYVASFDTNNVLKFDGTTGAFLDEFVDAGSGGLNSPHGSAFGPGGDLFVGSAGTNQVLRYDGLTGDFKEVFVPSGTGLINPVAIHFMRHPADLDDDFDVDSDDASLFASCVSGRGTPLAPGCEPSDFDRDGDVDCGDGENFKRGWTGPPSTPPVFSCPEIPEPPTALDAVCFNGATPTATPCGTNANCPVGQACRLKSRFLSINPADTAAAATPTALQVKVISVPNAPGSVNAPPYNYPGMVNDVWWVGAATNRVNDQSPYITAPLACTGTPLIQDWNAVGDIHIYGDAIVPGATYEIRACSTVSGPCSTPLVLASGKHGDVRDAFNLTNFADISALVGEFSTPNAPTSLIKSLAWITPSNLTTTMGAPFGFNQISAGVTAFSGGAPPAPTLGANQCP